MKFHFRSIRQKLQIIVLVTTLAALSLALIGNVVGDVWAFHRDMVADVSTQAELLGRMSSSALAFDDRRLAEDTLKLFETRPNIHAAAIYTDRGKLFASYAARDQPKNFPTFPETDGIRIDGRDLIAFKRIVSNGNVLGTVYVRADHDLSETIMENVVIAAAVGVIAMTVAFFMTARLEKVITGPISAVAGTAREVVEQRDYSRRVESTSDDEVGVLVEQFNDMLSEVERRTQELEASNREIAREIDERNRAQQEVMRLNADLELRVRERTYALEESNKALESAKAAAEEANEAKSAFLSSMSHELRTPLNAILGFGQLLDSSAQAPTDEQRREFVGYILKAGRHLLTLINEILDLAKVESGALTLSIEPVSLAEVMRECQEMIEPLGRQRDLQMTFPQNLEYAVMGDRTRLKQILLNLLSNAVKYNRSSGSIAVDCGIGAHERIRISVRDTGCGLDTEQLEKLFQPFNRLGQEASMQEGTGIGLVLTKRLVELMDGTIGAASTVDVGSVFWIELNASGSAAPLPRSTTVPILSATETTRQETPLPTLLYVEDNPTNLKLVEEIVRSHHGLRLLSAPDAHLGIQLARVHLPDVILMDIHLPGMNGIEALKVLRADPQTASIPVIAVTASAMPREVSAGMGSGFFRYVTKPLDIAEFMDAIDHALQAAANQHGRNP